MDLSQIVLNTLPSLFKYLLAPASVLILVAIFLTYSRSGSSHPILLKTWSLIFGKLEIKSDKIKKFSDDQTDLAHFTYLTKIKVGSLLQAERLITWAAERDISLQLIKNSGRYFDASLPGAKIELHSLTRKHVILRVLAVLLLAIPIFIGMMLGLYDRAILQMRATENYLTVSADYITPIFSDKKFLISDCGKPQYPAALEKADIEAICETEFNEKTKSELKNIVFMQRMLGWFLALYVSIFFSQSYFSLKKIHAALELRKKLNAFPS